MRRFALSILAGLPLAACASRPVPVAVATPPVVVAQVPAVSGRNYPGLVVPPRTADGGYATPNANVSAAAAVWHLRAGLNVAALSCRGPEEAALIAGYNDLLRAQGASLARAHQAVGREYGSAAAFDAGMTRLYNYYALPAAQPDLCATARTILTELAALPPDALDAAAPAALARLDQPYLTVFAAQDAWTTTRFTTRAAAMAVLPRIEVDRSALVLP